MLACSPERIFRIINIRLLEEANAYIFAVNCSSLAFIVLSNNLTQIYNYALSFVQKDF